MTTILAEFDGCDLGDARRVARLLMLAEHLSKDPELSFPEALPDRAALEACYRLVNNDAVDSQAILRPHVHATVARLKPHKRVLAVHDTTHFQPSAKATAMDLERVVSGPMSPSQSRQTAVGSRWGCSASTPGRAR
jgi:Transposase DNA-binding